MATTRLIAVLLAVSLAAPAYPTLLLPNTTGIDGELISKLGVDRFFSLWIVFNNDDVTTSGSYNRF